MHSFNMTSVLIFEKRAEFATRIYILTMLSVFPLFTGFDGYIALTEKKFAFFAVITSVWLLSLICIAAAGRYIPSGIKPGIHNILILVYMAACTVSTIFSPHAGFLSIETGRCDGLMTWLLYGCIFAGIARFARPHREYIYVAAGAYTVNCIITILQLLGLNPLWLYPNHLNYYDPFMQELCPFLGTLGNIDIGSAWNCLIIPLMCAECTFGKHRTRFLCIIPAVLGTVCVFTMNVASGVLSLAVTFSIFIPFWATGIFSSVAPAFSPSRIRRTTAITVAALWLIGLGFVFLVPGLPGFLGELHSILHGVVLDHFGSSRILIWKDTLNVAADNLFIGVGPDSLLHHLDIRFSRYSAALEQLIHSGVDNAHNEYLQLLVSFGLFGFIPLAVLMLLTLRRALPQLSRAPCALLLPSMLCYMIQAFFNIGLCVIFPLFMILWALTFSASSANHIYTQSVVTT